MNTNDFDDLSRTLAGRTSRRGALRTGSGLLAALLVGTRTRTAQAAPPSPPPAGELWLACAAEGAHPDYCIERFEVDGQPRLGDLPAGVELMVLGIAADPETTEVNAVMWEIRAENNVNSLLPPDWIANEILLELRTGQLHPTFGSSWARGIFVAVDGNNEDGWRATITGRPALMQLDSGDDSEQADLAGPTCHGQLYDVARFVQGGFVEGQFVSVNCMSASFPVWQEGAWLVNLVSPHFALAGTTNDGLTHASYSAWMSPGNLEIMGLTLEEAVAGQLAVTRSEDGVTDPIEFTIEERAGGVYIDIPDITFSAPELRFAKAKKDEGKGKKKKRKKKGKKKKGKKKKGK